MIAKTLLRLLKVNSVTFVVVADGLEPGGVAAQLQIRVIQSHTDQALDRNTKTLAPFGWRRLRPSI
jgi:hypothetical protein